MMTQEEYMDLMALRRQGKTIVEIAHQLDYPPATVSKWLNDEVWAQPSRRDDASRAAFVTADPIGGLAIARLGVDDVERWHARMRKAGVGETAIRGRHSALRAALGQAVRWGWLGANPAAAARLRQPSPVQRGPMRAEDVQAMIARTIDPLAAVALRLAAVAGLRRAELAALRWDDLDGDRLTVDSSAAVSRSADDAPAVIDSRTKTANRRTLRLDDATIAECGVFRAERERHLPYLFSLSDGPANPDRIGWWWRARELSGIDSNWRLHDLRHWSATMAITSGADVRTVAGRLGHTNPAMTLRVYAHVVEGADQRVADTLGALIDGQS